MAIPRDKYVTESNVILSQFIATAAGLGMPVALLQKVRKDYTIKYKRGTGLDHVKTFWNDLVLYEPTVQGLRQPGSQWADAVSVQTLYHEATHAVIDIDDVDDNGLFREAVYLYKQARLTNGRAVDDPERVAHEAAGTYVGHRAASAWQIFQKIEFWNTVLDKVEIGQLKPDRAQEILFQTLAGAAFQSFTSA